MVPGVQFMRRDNNETVQTKETLTNMQFFQNNLCTSWPKFEVVKIQRN